MPDFSLCAGCPIEGEYEPVDPNGPEDAPYLIVTDKPSQACADRGVALARGHKDMLMKHMATEDIDETEFRYHPTCLCPYDADQYTNQVKKKIHQHCRAHLEDYIDETKPAAILPLGAEASTQVFNKPTKITKVRGLGHPSLEFGVPVFPLMNPSLACRYVQNEPILAADCASFGRLIDAGLDVDEADNHTYGEYIEIDDLEFLIEQNPEIISFDTEGTGLRWYQRGVDVRTYRPALHKGKPWFKPRAQILTMQFCIEPGKAYVLVWDHPERPIDEAKKPKLRNQLRRLLCNPDTLVVGQNTKFDQVYLWMLEGIRFQIGGDTQMLAAIHDENLPEKNLDVLTKIFAPEMAGYADRFNATIDKSRMWEVDIETIIPYGGGDPDAALRVYNTLEELVAQDEGNWNHYVRVSLPGLNAFGSIETKGMYVDSEHALPEFQEYLTEVVKNQRDALLRRVPKEIKREHLAKAKKGQTAEEVLSFTRPAFVKDILFYHPKGFRLKPVVFTKTTERLPDHLKEPSISSKDHLPFFFDKCDFTIALAEYVKDATLLRNNVINFQEKFVVGGKVRPTYGMAKAVTRRTNSADPNGQNFPKRGEKAKKYQRIFNAPEGYYVISRDLSQAELRIAGEMARDPVIIKIYQEDGDIHVSTACIVKGVTEAQFKLLPKAEQKDGRQKAKAVNFGFIYGMGWRKFITYAKTQYGVTFTEKEAKRIRDAYFVKYAGLARWHKNTREYVMRHGYVRSFSGLVRHLPMVNSSDEGTQQEAIRQGINSPVQEFGSTLGVIALGRMNEEVDPDALQIIGFIHDALYAYVRKEHLEWGLKTLGYYMESADLKEMFGLTMRIPIKSDPSFGLNMGDQFELADFPRDDTPYDWGHECLRNPETGELLIEVPEQEIPENDGMLTRSPYTTPDDLEPETAPSRRVRMRRVGVRISEVSPEPVSAAKRVSRSKPEPVVKRVTRSRG